MSIFLRCLLQVQAMSLGDREAVSKFYNNWNFSEIVCQTNVICLAKKAGLSRLCR